MEIRRERPVDYSAVAAVHRAAFAAMAPEGAEPVEVALTDRLRDGPWWLPHLSLVAVSPDGEVIGHVIGTRAVVEPSDVDAVGVGPLGVAPAWQRAGVGSALMHAVLGAAEASGESLVALLGDPAFYTRFGFTAAAGLGITAPDPAWGAAFQARRLAGPAISGTFRYAAPFGLL